MEKEEKYILDKVGRRTPFTVPEGYFDDLAERLMAQLPEAAPAPAAREVSLRPVLWHRFKPLSIAAASIVAAVFALGVCMRSGDGTEAAAMAASTDASAAGSSYTEVDAMADYAMLDSEDLYAYMQESE